MKVYGTFPAVRMRRMRRDDFSRRLMREHVLTANDLIYPVFILDGKNRTEKVASMPGVERLSVDEAVRDAERGSKLAIPCLALFPYTDARLRDENGSEAVNPDSLVCRAIRAIMRPLPPRRTLATGDATTSAGGRAPGRPPAWCRG